MCLPKVNTRLRWFGMDRHLPCLLATLALASLLPALAASVPAVSALTVWAVVALFSLVERAAILPISWADILAGMAGHRLSPGPLSTGVPRKMQACGHLNGRTIPAGARQ